MGGITGILSGISVAAIGGAKEGLKVEGIVTAGGAIAGAIAGALSALGANSRRAKAAGLDMNTLLDYLYNKADFHKAQSYSPKDTRPERYIIEDGDPNKFMVNFAYEDGKLVINLKNQVIKLFRVLMRILKI